MRVEFFCVSGRDFFPGAVALVNSLRLVGHTEPVTLLDCGLDDAQRELIAGEVDVVAAPDGSPPSLQKLVAPLASTADVIVILDADIIVIRHLGELIQRAAAGTLVGFENETDRYFEREWGTALGSGALRRGPYLSSSALIMAARTAREILPVVADLQRSLDQGQTWLSGGERSDPFFFADQDLINAVALDRLPAERVSAVPTRLAPVPPFDGLRLRDPATLRCEYSDGERPYMLHHYSRKPWLVRTRANVYSRLLTRTLLAPDVAVRVDPATLPQRLRRGVAGAVARTATDLIKIPAGVRRRLRRGPSERISAWQDRSGAEAGR